MQAGSRVICMCDMSWAGLVLLGTLDFHIHAVSSSDQTHLWSTKLNDSVLSLVAHESSSLYAALADGCIAVLHVSAHCTCLTKLITQPCYRMLAPLLPSMSLSLCV